MANLEPAHRSTSAFAHHALNEMPQVFKVRRRAARAKTS
jgi:hypothetical protein